jgi:undecaprenyl-diphosphatase
VPHITILQSIILGLIQGLTEFLPVSSTGHMRIIPAELHWPDPGAGMSAILQLGPILSIIAFFRADLGRYLAGIKNSISKGVMFPKGDVDAKLGWFTLIGTIPLAIAGLALEHKVNTTFRSLDIIAWCLIVLAILLLIVDFTSKRTRKVEDVTLTDTIIIGVAQAFALVPGASRSGCTITAGLLRGLDREAAARFSFLLSIPAITLAGLYKLLKEAKLHHIHGVVVPGVIGAVVAGIVAYVVIKWFLKFLGEENHTTLPFIIWRIAVGVLILWQLHTGYLKPDTGLTPDDTSTQPTTASVSLAPPARVAALPGLAR